MKLVGWMLGAGALSWLGVVALVDPGLAIEVLMGMLGPLLAASVSWLLIERTARRQPDRLTSLMAGAFAAKMLFFGAYVAIVVKTLSIRPVPFAVSFTAYFIALHAVEAIALRRIS